MSQIDWPGLLKWSMKFQEETPAGVPEAEAKYEPLTQEQKEFLEKAIASVWAEVEDAQKAFIEAVNVLQAEPPAPRDKILVALKVIDQRLEDEPDLSRCLDKYDAVTALTRVVELYFENIDIREACSSILSYALPNNPKIQEDFYEKGLLKHLFTDLINRVEEDLAATPAQPEPACVRVFAREFQALSSLIKNAPPQIEATFRESNGHLFVTRCKELAEKNNHERVLSKALVLQQYLNAPPEAKQPAAKDVGNKH